MIWALLVLVVELVAIAAATTTHAIETAAMVFEFVNVAVAVGLVASRAAHASPSASAPFELDVRFGIRTLMIAMGACCGFLGLARLHGAEIGVLLLIWFSTAIVLVVVSMGEMIGCVAILVFHVFLSAFLLLGPIASYHVNGRAWYDYGISGWNPPLSIDENGTIWRGDYDSAYTPPASWPIIGRVLRAMCLYALGVVIFPPIAPLAALMSAIVVMRYRRYQTHRQRHLLVATWSAAVCPLVYLVIWGDRVLAWVAD